MPESHTSMQQECALRLHAHPRAADVS